MLCIGAYTVGCDVRQPLKKIIYLIITSGFLTQGQGQSLVWQGQGLALQGHGRGRGLQGQGQQFWPYLQSYYKELLQS